jgi:glycosyltransferase involved in cell wall biosynthesis
VHAHMPRASMPAALAARLSRVPVVISHEHGSVLGTGKGMRRFVDRHFVARFSDAIVAVSDFDRQNLIATEGIAPELIRVLRNGTTPLPVRARVRGELAPPGVPLVLAVGRLAAVKGYDVLIRAAAALRDDGRAVRVAIAGDGPERGALSGLIAALGLEREVTLLGLRSDVGDLLAAADVVVMSSHSEGAPLAVLEYMAAGTPIVATKVGGIPELIDDGVHGLLVAPGHPAALAAEVARILDDRDLADRLAGAARIRRSTEFDLSGMVERLQLLYEELFAAVAPERTGRTDWSPATA